MSETEDIRAAVDGNDFHRVVEEESGRSSSVDYLDSYEDAPKETAKEYSEESNEEDIKEDKERESFKEHAKKPYETERKEATQPAETGEASLGVQDADARREERVESVASGVDGRENGPVGEWNSLPALVERLRAALKHSLAQGSRRDDEPTTQPLPEDSGVDSEEDFRVRRSMEQALSSREPELKKDLKFLEDLLLSDIQTALSRLRETLERTDVAALARNGAASDPNGKLQLLKLVSSLLSRLQLPEQAPEQVPAQILAQLPEQIPEKIPMLPATSSTRRRRATRHTIGVSAEELARARKWLEEERNATPLSDVVIHKEPKEQPSVTVIERKTEEIRDKCTKDAINQRQLLEDKNKEREIAYRGIQQVEEIKQSGESMYQPQYRGSFSYQVKESNEDSEENEDKSHVSKLAAALRQRAELAASGAGKYPSGNKFTAKKTKIKRANTIDIPSYLKLQESLGHDSTGCVSLRRPIHVGDKTALNSANVAVPSFQPRTENDRKFLALINKNNEPPPAAPVAPFKTTGFVKNMDENWNSRFSNIKTTFDKSTNEEKDKPSPKNRVAKRFPQAQMYSPPSERRDSGSSYAMKVEPTGGFRHAPSSPFRKIEKPTPASPFKVPASHHWPKTPTPTNTLREKARMMFDRENVPPSSKSRVDVETQEKGFPRPPWLDHDRNEGRANGTVTENGKLDYRSFCKQFAPFVGKGSAESKKLEEQRQREPTQRDRIPGVVDGKISFKIPDQRIQTQQYPPARREVRDKIPGRSRNMFEVIKSGDRGYNETESPRTSGFPDATLRGSSSVAVQTGIDDDHQDEGRSFRVAPKISKGPALLCTNASVQTSSELDRPAVSVSAVDSEKQWKPLYYDQPGPEEVSDSVYPAGDRQRFLLDHNQNYRTVPSDSEVNPLVSLSSQVPSDQSYKEVPRQTSQENPEKNQRQSEVYQTEDKENQSHPAFVSSGSGDYSQLENEEEKPTDWAIENNDFLDDQNIQNQDISTEVGVVTRYTCAIATVASVDSPEPRSEEIAADSRTSSSPSPSQFSWTSPGKSRPPTSETVTPEDEIRRHNLLQQSLVRRLQNEITSLNDQPSSFNQYPAVSPSKAFNQPSSAVPSYNQSPNVLQSCNQPAAHSQSYQPSPNETPSHMQPGNLIHSQRTSPNLPPNIVQSHQASFSQAPSHVPSGNFIQSQQTSPNLPANIVQSLNQAPSHAQSGNFIQSQQTSPNLPANIAQSHQASLNQPSIASYQPSFPPANFDQPPSSHVANRYAKFLAPVPQRKPEAPRTLSPGSVTAHRVGALREAYEVPSTQSKPIHKERSPVPNGATPNDSSDEYLVSCATKPSRSIVLSKSESWHQLAISNSYPRAPRVNIPASPSVSHPKPPKPKSPSSQKLRSKQFEASIMADNVKRMEDKIRQYFDSPVEMGEAREHSRSRRSPRAIAKGMVALSRSRTMPGIPGDAMRLEIPAPQQPPLLNVNTADVDKVFDDLFEEATRSDGRRC